MKIRVSRGRLEASIILFVILIGGTSFGLWQESIAAGVFGSIATAIATLWGYNSNY